MSGTSRRLGRILAAPPRGDAGLSLQRGTVVTWDATDGFTVYVTGTNFTSVLVLAGVTGLMPGDQVAVLRQPGSVLILGKITAPT